MKNTYLRALGVLPAAALLIALPARAATGSETAARIESEAAELHGDAAKASLKALDVELDELDAIADNAPTPEERTAAKARIDALKERRSELRKTYVKARYDELKADIKAESNRVSSWTKSKFKKDPAEKAGDAMKDAGDQIHAYGSSTGAAMDLAAYKLRPTDTNKEEAKAALKALDARIDELDDRADNMPKGPDRDAAKRRVDALEDRKDALEDSFDKARFNALVDEVTDMWK